MLGYMCSSEAKFNGYSHHGSYYGVPVWVGGLDDVETGGFITIAKWYPLEYLVTVIAFFESIYQAFMYPDDERVYMYLVKYPI